jgi:hypothetical protein
MSHCYVCGTEINETNKTEEHILLNAIGGKLKSTTLLCKQCNSEFGEDIDSELAKQLNPICNMLNIKRDRGEPQPIQATIKTTGEHISLDPGGKPVMLKPKIEETKVNDGTIRFSISARNEQQARQILKGFQRKYKNLDIDKVLATTEKRRTYLDDQVTFSVVIGGEKAFRSICKTAVNFYIYDNGDRRNISHLLDYIKYGNGNNPLWYCYLDTEVINKQPKDILHSIVLVGNQAEKILYAYIELFNAIKFIVLLNDNYIGRDIYTSYCYDVIGRNRVARSVNLDLNREQVKGIIQTEKDPTDDLLDEYNKLIPLILEKQDSDHISEMIDRALDRSLKKYPEGTIITKSMVKELIDALMDEITPWIMRNFEK